MAPFHSHPVRFRRLLWIILAVFAPGTIVVPHFMVVGIGVGVLCFLGLRIGWGPLIPCAFFGAILFSLLTSPVAGGGVEVVYQTFGMPLVGLIFGAVVGAFADKQLRMQMDRDDPETYIQTSQSTHEK